MTSLQSVSPSGFVRFSPSLIMSVMLIGILTACGGGGGGGGGSSGVSSLASLQTKGKPWEGDTASEYNLSSGSYWSASRYKRLSYAHDKIGLGRTIGVRNTGANVRVAVVDDEIDIAHPDLWDNIPMRADGQIEGRSFLDGTAQNYALTINREYKDISHGTHVAGIIAAVDNGRGVRGVAPEAKIIPVTLLRSDTQDRSRFVDVDPEQMVASATLLKNIMKYIND